MAENAADKILIGADRSAPLYSFSTENPKEVKRLSCVLSSALSGDELAIDQLLPTVYSEVVLRVPFVPSGSSGAGGAVCAVVIAAVVEFPPELPP